MSLQWPRFASHVDKTVKNAPENVAYKVFYIGRHGEGYHNVAEVEHGTAEWEVRNLLGFRQLVFPKGA